MTYARGLSAALAVRCVGLPSYHSRFYSESERAPAKRSRMESALGSRTAMIAGVLTRPKRVSRTSASNEPSSVGVRCSGHPDTDVHEQAWPTGLWGTVASSKTKSVAHSLYATGVKAYPCPSLAIVPTLGRSQWVPVTISLSATARSKILLRVSTAISGS